MTFLLNFIQQKKKKYAYAASFGISKIESKYVIQYKKLLTDFSLLTVREKEGKRILKEQMGLSSEVVLDPTLLINTDQWNKLTDNRLSSNYILVYLLINSDSIISFANNLSKDTGLKIIVINNTPNDINGCQTLYCITVNEWIGLFLNATYVITNSFHGTAFSIIFNKQFFIEFLPSQYQVNSRLENILDMFELCDRQINNKKYNNLYDCINYEKVNKIMDKEREKALAILKYIIENNNEQD